MQQRCRQFAPACGSLQRFAPWVGAATPVLPSEIASGARQRRCLGGPGGWRRKQPPEKKRSKLLQTAANRCRAFARLFA
eukprot:11050694-Alexandrium_andersonii.AAC.1